jgi:hypothetical protein
VRKLKLRLLCYSIHLAFSTDMFKIRRKQRAALDKHFGKEERNLRPAAAAVPKKISTMEQASQENLGWRQLDAQQEFLRWD